jgi:hypothetical protein
MKSAWLIGAQYLPEQELQIDGGPEIITAGIRYLYKVGAPGLSWLGAVRQALLDAGVTGAQVSLQRDRKVRIYADNDFELEWPADNVLRNLLGFTLDLDGSADSYVAANVSPLLWSPGRTENPKAPMGSLGELVPHVAQAVSPYDGSTVTVRRGSGRRYNEFSFIHMAQNRVWTPDELPGELFTFFHTVIASGYYFHLWRNIDESDSSTDLAQFTTGLGPYVYSTGRRGPTLDPVRAQEANFQWTDKRWNDKIPVHVVPEYDEP